MHPCSSSKVLQCSLVSLCQGAALKVNCDSSQFAQWVGLVPVSEGINKKVKNNSDVYEWMAVSLTFVFFSLLLPEDSDS